MAGNRRDVPRGLAGAFDAAAAPLSSPAHALDVLTDHAVPDLRIQPRQRAF